VELRDQLSGMTLDIWGDATAVTVDEVHHEEIGVSIVDMRDRGALTGAPSSFSM
jgi:hypothetical protein